MRMTTYQFDDPTVELVLQGLQELSARVETTMSGIARGHHAQREREREQQDALQAEAAAAKPRRVSRRASQATVSRKGG